MRRFRDADGLFWQAEIVSHGRTSGYLNPKVHRPIVQFTCIDQPLPRLYAPLPGDDLGALAEGALLRLLGRARPH